jgi:hypothetical protein
LVTDSNGNLIRSGGYTGVELNGGVSLSHGGRRYRIGLDYRGAYQRYTPAGYNTSLDHSLDLNYRRRVSRLWSIDLRQRIYTGSTGVGFVAQSVNADNGSGFSPASQFLSARNVYSLSTASATWIMSGRSSLTLGADYTLHQFKYATTTHARGYYLNSRYSYRLSKSTTVGGTYSYGNFNFTNSQSDTNTGMAFVETDFARYWTVAVNAGITKSEVSGIQLVNLPAALAQAVGLTSINLPFSQNNLFPSGSVQIGRRFEHSAVSLNYTRGFSTGNSVLFSSRQEIILATYSLYTSNRLNFGFSGGHWKYGALGVTSQEFTTYSMGGGFSYRLGHSLHAVSRYDYRKQSAGTFNFGGNRISAGIAFSPGSRPLHLW